MTQKNFGPAVSGYLDTDARAFEQAVFQSGKAVLDKELNLAEDLAAGAISDFARRTAPSGWLTEDPLSKSDPLSGVFSGSTTADLLTFSNQLQAFVNGWLIDVKNTGSNSSNLVTLAAAPAGNGAKRTDIVILEVWRRLISPSPSTDGKSTGGRIWRHGNVKVPSADDATLNLADDLLDGNLGAESTKRVQIQYRLRAVSGVDLFAYPTGIDDPAVVANTVPAIPTSPDGTASAFTFTNQSSNGDPGLWRAGDGNPANGLGTVDGYMYAIPMVAVFRRNSTAFDRNLNHNGGVAYPGPSDRPDGLFHDIIDRKDIADLRRAVTPRGWHSYQEIGEKHFGYLLDNILRTEWGTTALGGGHNGHTLFWADEIGVLPGDGTTTGDTPGAEFIGQFDCTRRFFSDRPNYEILTFKIAPGSPNVSTATWQAGTVVTISATQLAQYPFTGAIGFLNRAPNGIRVIDVVRARIEGSTALEMAFDVGQTYAQAPSTVPDPIPVEEISGLGEFPVTDVLVTLGTPPLAGLTTEPIYIDLLVAYPSGVGLSKTPSADFGAASFLVNNPGSLPGVAPVSYASMQTQAFNAVNREVQLQYKTVSLTYTFSASSTANSAYFSLPERVQNILAVRINGVPYAGSSSMDAAGRVLHITGAGDAAPGDVVEVDYEALRPMPQSGVQMTIFYEARAPQTVRSSLLGTSVTMVPRWISPHLYCITSGSGSQGEGYPYPFAYVQTGGILKDGTSWSGEHELDGSPEISVADFNAATGFLKLNTYVPYVPAPEAVTFTRNLSDTDIEGRTYLPSVPVGYAPNAFAQSLSNGRVHKVVLPAVMELAADTTLDRKGTLFLVLLTRWANFDAENSVKFLTANNTTTAAVFRLAGNLANRRM